MLSEVFYWVLNASILGGAAGLFVLVLRRIKALPRSMVYALWLIPLVRLWLPFGIASRYSLLSLVSRYATRTVVIRGKLPQITASNSVMAASSYFPIEYKTNLLESLFNVAAVLWIIVCAAAILASVMLYRFSMSELRFAEHIEGDSYKSGRVSTPAVYGILHPRIIIPDSLACGNIRYILMHESIHVRRRDNLFRAIALFTACFHWFNPLSWILLKYFFTDMELSCDSKVLKELDEKQAREYAGAILACSSGKTFLASAFGGAGARVRIESILSYKRLTLFSSLCFAALVLVISVILITNASV